MFEGADPGIGWEMTDPIYGKPPTMGACMPQIRRNVVVNDYIFSISGRAKGVSQYLVGGFQVKDKINALLAREKFPQYRQVQNDDGSLSGNIIVDENGNQNPYDYHNGDFEKRIENYIIGKNPIYFDNEADIEKARGNATIEILQDIFNKEGNKPHDIIGRWRRLDEKQIQKLINWMEHIKQS
tara:strand:- start:2943 stop:3491 length:549 start_codon:yes stop_codon:yes gene_type:complete